MISRNHQESCTGNLLVPIMFLMVASTMFILLILSNFLYHAKGFYLAGIIQILKITNNTLDCIHESHSFLLIVWTLKKVMKYLYPPP